MGEAREAFSKYQEIVDALTGFMDNTRDPDKVDAVYAEVRRLWIYGPDDVACAGQEYIDKTIIGGSHTSEESEQAMAEFVLSMRRDASFWAAMFPRLNKTKLKSEQIKFAVARRED